VITAPTFPFIRRFRKVVKKYGINSPVCLLHIILKILWRETGVKSLGRRSRSWEYNIQINLKELDPRVCTYKSGSGKGQKVICSEQGNEPSGSTKCGGEYLA
jgi:hypothetical protein